MTPHPADLTIAEAGAALRGGALTCVALTEAHLARIAERNPGIGAFVHVATDAALAAARAADAVLAEGQDLGPLHGIPFAIKDIFDVAGWPVRSGSRLCQGYTPRDTAAAVQAMCAAGAVPLGLVATYELATVGPDSQSLYPQPRNPWNHSHITGGSSSGSAAAVASGMVRLALGTDTGGSVRSPSAYCGAVGLKPTYGAVSVAGVMPLAPSLDHIGPIARTVAEVALAFVVLADRDVPALTGIAGLRVAYGRDWCHDDAADAGLLDLLDAAASVLTLCGASLALTPLPEYAPIEAAAACILRAEEFATHGAAIAATPGAVGPMAADSIMAGAKITPQQRAKAQKSAEVFGDALDAALADHDVLILPTTLTTAPPFSALAGGKAVWTAMCTIPFNLTGHPALSLPMGFVGGLPLGLQVVGRHGDEAMVLRVGAAFEAATDHAALTPYAP